MTNQPIDNQDEKEIEIEFAFVGKNGTHRPEIIPDSEVEVEAEIYFLPVYKAKKE